MLNEGKGIRLSQLAAVAVLVGGIGWVALRLMVDRGSVLPHVSWLAAVVIALAAALVLAAGLPVRRFLRGEARSTLSPLKAARTLVLAQASAITGSGVTGWYLGVLAHVLATRDLASSQAILWPTVASALAGALLVAAGLVVQRWCRVEPPSEGSAAA